MSVPALLKQAEHDFEPYMRSLGFERVKRKPMWVRQLNDVFHAIHFEGSGWGGGFWVSVKVWTPSLLSRKKAAEVKDVYKAILESEIGGTISEGGVADGEKFAEYGVTPEEDQSTFRRLIAVIGEMVLPWFALFSTREDIARNLKSASDGEIDGASRIKKRLLEDVVEQSSNQSTNQIDQYPFKAQWSDVNAYCPFGFYDASPAEEASLLAAGFIDVVEYLEGRGFKFIRAPEFRFLRGEPDNIWHEIRFYTENRGLHIRPTVSIWFPEYEVAFGKSLTVGPPGPMQGTLSVPWDGDEFAMLPIWSAEKMRESVQEIRRLHEDAWSPALRRANDKSYSLSRIKEHIAHSAKEALRARGIAL